jgi:hypothetical protein
LSRDKTGEAGRKEKKQKGKAIESDLSKEERKSEARRTNKPK